MSAFNCVWRGRVAMLICWPSVCGVEEDVGMAWVGGAWRTMNVCERLLSKEMKVMIVKTVK